jgi:hypothetical protein
VVEDVAVVASISQFLEFPFSAVHIQLGVLEKVPVAKVSVVSPVPLSTKEAKQFPSDLVIVVDPPPVINPEQILVTPSLGDTTLLTNKGAGIELSIEKIDHSIDEFDAVALIVADPDDDFVCTDRVTADTELAEYIPQRGPCVRIVLVEPPCSASEITVVPSHNRIAGNTPFVPAVSWALAQT